MTKHDPATKSQKVVIRVDADLEPLIPGFLRRKQEALEAMLGALERSDYGALQVSGHKMNGAGEGYGFHAITDIGRSIEQAARDKNPEAVRKLLGELSTYLKRVEVVYE